MTPSTDPGHALDHTRLLVVDDDDASVKLVQAIFADHDCVLLAVSNAADALKAIPLFRPDILLIEIVLPFMSGFDLTRILKNHHETRNLVVIAVTASNGATTEKQARDAGCEAYIRKPIDPIVFAEQVTEVWVKARDTRASARGHGN